MTDSKTSVQALVHEARWVYYPERRRKDYIRDGVVIDSQAMTFDEVKREMRKQPLGPAPRVAAKQKPKQEVSEVTETGMQPADGRWSEYVGRRFGSLVVTAVEGRDARRCLWLFSAKCDCGADVEGIVKGELDGGKKKYCDGVRCPVARRDHAANRASCKRVSLVAPGVGDGTLAVTRPKQIRRAARRVIQPAEAPQVASTNVAQADAVVNWVTGAALGEDAALFRKVAVWLERDVDSKAVIGLLRDRANTLDGLVFGSQIAEHLSRLEEAKGE